VLVIRRRSGESFFIGPGEMSEPVEVEILDIESGQVKVGIRAPRHIPILRREIAATAHANAQAAGVSPEKMTRLLAQLPRRKP
jgi:carbon storage regulator